MKWEKMFIDWAKKWGYTEDQLKEMMPAIDWGGYVVGLVGFLADLLPQMFLIVLFVVYMLLDFDAAKEKTELRRSIDQKIRRYILVCHNTKQTKALSVGFKFIFSFSLNIGAQPCSVSGWACDLGYP